MSTSNFRIEKALGKGAFGAVYKVYSLKLTQIGYS